MSLAARLSPKVSSSPRLRLASLKYLITTDPEAALREALPFEVRRELPASILRHLEIPIHDEGSYEVTTTCYDLSSTLAVVR